MTELSAKLAAGVMLEIRINDLVRLLLLPSSHHVCDRAGLSGLPAGTQLLEFSLPVWKTWHGNNVVQGDGVLTLCRCWLDVVGGEESRKERTRRPYKQKVRRHQIDAFTAERVNLHENIDNRQR